MRTNGEDEVGYLSNEVLARRCTEERERFFRQEQADNRYCFELFRRALVHRNEYAWEIVYDQYAPLVSGWIRRSSGFQTDSDDLDELVNLVFTRFWQSVTPEKFARFDSLESLLQYLRLCAGSVVMDNVRRQKRKERFAVYEPFLSSGNHHNVEEQVVDNVTRRDFWNDVQARLGSEAEEKVVYGYFVLGLKPREIQAAYPDIFPSVEQVYRTKRNVLNRLRRSDLLHRWLNE